MDISVSNQECNKDRHSCPLYYDVSIWADSERQGKITFIHCEITEAELSIFPVCICITMKDRAGMNSATQSLWRFPPRLTNTNIMRTFWIIQSQGAFSADVRIKQRQCLNFDDQKCSHH